MKIKAALIAVLIACMACSREPGSDSEIRQAIQEAWNRPEVGLLLGDVRFVDAAYREPRGSRGEDASSEWPLYAAFADTEIVVISEERDLTDRASRRGDWAKLLNEGVKRTAHVSLTDKGRVSGELTLEAGVEKVLLRVRTVRVQEIVANEPLTFGADEYRIAMGTHTWDIPEDFKSAYLEARGSHGRERRFKALLKYDPFAKKWKFLGADQGPRAGEFSTTSVDSAVARLR